MLNKNDNPDLFYEIANAYRNETKDMAFRPYSASILTDEQLLAIKSINLSKVPFGSLKGLSQLKNLEELTIEGNHYYDGAEKLRREEKSTRFDKEKAIKEFVDNYQQGQISNADLQEIYELKNLKFLNIKRQRHITELDLSKLSKLEKVYALDCTKLERVNGLSQIEAIKEGNEYKFDFSGSYRLAKVDDLEATIKNVEDSAQMIGSNITLPTATYARIYRENRDNAPETLKKLESNLVRDSFVFADICDGGVRCNHNATQMRMATERCEDIIRTVNADNPENDINRLSNWYRWICDNVTYDHETLKTEENATSKFQQTRARNVTRSTFETLWRKTGVCVGIRNLFNYGAELMNFSALPEYCQAATMPNLAEDAIADHALSVMILKDGNGNQQPMFFDPTWDLGSKESGYFMLTYDQMQKLSHNFTIESDEYKNMGTPITKSLLADLKMLGALETRPPKQAARENA